MSARAKATLVLCAAALLASIAVAPANAEPTLGLQLTRTAAPATHSDERLAYQATVRNTASANPVVGTELTCLGTPEDGKQWFGGNPAPSFEIQWLRNGERIPGTKGPAASAKTYVVTAADEGKSIQCLVFASSDPDGAGSAYAPITATAVSRPPVVVEPQPSPAPPRGVSRSEPSGIVVAPTGTATTTSGSNVLTEVITARGSGDLEAGSKLVKGLVTSSGQFVRPRFNTNQEISGEGILAGTTVVKVISPSELELSQPASETKAGAILSAGSLPFAAGALFSDGMGIEGPGIPPGTKITKTEGKKVFLSANATASASGVSVTGISELTCPAPEEWSGFATASTTAGSNLLSRVVTAEGGGRVTEGSKLVTGVNTTNGAFEVGQTITEPFPFPKIASGTKIVAVGAGTLELSVAAVGEGLDARLIAGPQPFEVGQTIEGPGIPSGTTIAALGPLSLTLSNPATATARVSVKGPGIGGASWSFQWLRNGEPIPGATDATYKATSADTEPPSMVQCEAIAKDEAGNEAVTISGSHDSVPQPPDPYGSPAMATLVVPTVAFSNELDGEIAVQFELPPKTQALRAFGSGWSCTRIAPTPSQSASVSCTREDPLPPTDSYPPIELSAQVLSDAADTLATKASVSGGGAATVEVEDTASGILPAVPFGFKAFETQVLDSEGHDFTQAGGHPFSAGASLEFNDHVRAEKNAEVGFRGANGYAREIRTDVPPGFVGDPEAVSEKCGTVADVVALPAACPAGSVVGGITLRTELGNFIGQPIYVIEPERGTPAQFAFGVAKLKPGFAYTLTPELRPEDGYAISLVAAPAQKTPELFEAEVTLCDRGAKLGADQDGETKFVGCNKPTDPGANPKPFLTLPTRCGDPVSTLTEIYADSWEEPGNYAKAQFSAPDLTGCESLHFEPELPKARPTTTNADSPTGLDFELEIPQEEDSEGTATAQLKKAVVTLPEGLVINPSGANGLDACTSAQIKLGTNDQPTCPDASKVGTVEAETPILDHPLPGTLYVASPYDNPFNSLLALYLVIESPDDGLLIKLPGQVSLNQATGQITSTFDQNPQAPVSNVRLKVRGGASAPLRTPSTCGKYTTTASLTPWSAPQSGPPATAKDNWSISKGPGGKACASPLPNSPSFEAGTTSPIAGAYSPFVLKLRREDGSQTFSALNVTPPPGLLGKLAGIPYCPEAALAAAAAKSGKQEQASPSCPLASRVGSVTAGAGAGPAPYYAQGTAYLSGPYKGAPLSLAIVTPAVAGPFDLGTVVVRTALNVDPETAKITAVSDPLPQILQGIPLDIRSVTVSLDRPSFTLNPTSCDPMAVTGSLISSSGSAAPLSNRFQVGECSRLGFKPNLAIKLKGATKRTGHPALTATLNYPKGAYANIASASVALPHSEFLDQAHIKTICTRVQFAADACPAGAIYGTATAVTPLLDQPLTGPVYLRSSSNPLPDLVVDLRGQIHVALVGRIDSKNGGIRTTFASVPDAPVSKFTLQMQGGKKGLLINSRDICKSANKATAEFTGQNGKELVAKPVLGAKCPKVRKGKRGGGKR